MSEPIVAPVIDNINSTTDHQPQQTMSTDVMQRHGHYWDITDKQPAISITDYSINDTNE